MTQWQRSHLMASSWLATFLLLDVVVPSTGVAFTIFFAIAPLIACASLPPRTTAAYGVTAVTLTVASVLWNGMEGEQYWLRALDVALVSAAAVVVARVRVQREARLSRVLAIADTAQRAILPTLPGRLGDLRIGVRYVSAAQEALVGGDLYDMYHADGRVRVLVADVRGKGLDAVQQAAQVIRAFRQAAALGRDVAEVAEAMQQHLGPAMGDEDFVTALLVEVGPDGTLTLTSAGHPPPLLAHHGQVVELCPPPGLPLGIANGVDGPTYSSIRQHWQPGDRLLLYTDGLIEARDAAGQFLPPSTIRDCLAAGDQQQALDGLLAAVSSHVASGARDDIALVALDNAAGEEPATGGQSARRSVATSKPKDTTWVRATTTTSAGSDLL